jgi:hypothetical protein
MPPPAAFVELDAEPSSMVTPVILAVSDDLTTTTLAPFPSRMTELPVTVGCMVIDVEMVKLAPLAG